MSSAPFARLALALVGGIVAYAYFPEARLPALLAGLAGLGLFAGGWWQATRSRRGFGGFAASIGLYLLTALLGWWVSWQHTPANEGRNLVHQRDSVLAYVGVVDGLPEARAKTYRVELLIRRAQTRAGWQPQRGRVLVYLDKAKAARPRYGDVWLVLGAPRPIDPPLNPAEFDYRRYLSQKGIYHQHYLREHQRQVLGHAPPNPVTALATRLNSFADSVFTRQIGSRAESGIVNAMLLGVRDDVDPDLYRAYAAAGAVHVLSVSGLHVGILFNVLVLALGLLRRGRQSRREKLLVGLAQLSVLWFYALVTGLSPAVLRSAGMFSVLILGNATGRDTNLANTLGASAFFILLFDPYALFSAGFQLSYAAVAGIGAWHAPLYEQWTIKNRFLDHLWNLTAVALVAQLATFPLGIYYFHQFPTYFLLANPLVMDLVAVLLPLAMISLGLSGVPYLREVSGFLLQKLTWLLNYCVSQTSQLPGGLWEKLWLSPVELLLVYGLMLAGLYAWISRQKAYGWLATALALVLMGFLLSDELSRRQQRRLAVHFLPHKTALSLTAGSESVLLTDLDLPGDPRSFDFYLKNTFGLWGVQHLQIVSIERSTAAVTFPAGPQTGRPAYHSEPAYTLWVWRGKTVLLVNRLRGSKRWRLPAVVDYVIIRRNALQQWSDLNRRLVARQLIFDDSNQTALTDRLLREARQRQIPCYSVRQQGAFVATW